MKSGIRVMHVLSHTHWDREWYQEFQGFRQRLVFQMDALLDLYDEQPGYRCFHLDGQTAALFDYLEIRPQARGRIEKHLRDGRLLIGPWFTMPDERLLSGESLVRNLMLGHRHCRDLGAKPMPIGYVIDVFGHCSQFPQILKGFGIEAAMLHRGTGTLPGQKTEMVWRGADGSDGLLIMVYPWTGYRDFLDFREWTEEKLREYETRKTALATTDVLYALDGNDHQPAKWDLAEQMERVNAVFEGIECVHSSVPRYLAALRRAMGPDWKKGRMVQNGELAVPAREGTYTQVKTGIGSSRVDLKQRNDELERLLPRSAEALAAWARTLGHGSQKGFLDLAWRYLLLNHPHDSICGCSADQVHRDMLYRFDQSGLLARNAAWESIQAVGDRIDTEALGGTAAVTVFNTGAAETGPVTELRFELDPALVSAKAREGLEPALFDARGGAVPCEVLSVERNVRAEPPTYIADRVDGLNLRSNPAYRQRDASVDAYRVAAAVPVPALGYGTFAVGFRLPESGDGILPHGIEPVLVEERAMENGLMRVAVAEDGTVELLDKATGTSYKGLFVFEDAGDAGEGWNHQYPTGDVRVLSTDRTFAGGPVAGIRRAGRLLGSLSMRFSMRVPEDLLHEREAGSGERGRQTTRRSENTVELRFETAMTLAAGSGRLDCRTTVHNTARCHRVRVLFPTGLAADAWYGDSAFDVVKRPIRLRDTTGWKEQAREETVIKNFAAVTDGRAGLAVLTRGLQEAAVRDDEERTLALTLFRAFRERILNETTEDSQLPGDVTLEYALVPFRSEKDAPAALLAEADRYKMPLFYYTRPLQKGSLPLEARFLEIGQPAAVSTIKGSEDGKAIIVRIWNPTEKAVTVPIRPSFAFRKAARTDFLEKPEEPLAPSKKGVRIRLGRKQVATVRFDLRG